jgi:hypothetical protein
MKNKLSLFAVMSLAVGCLCFQVSCADTVAVVGEPGLAVHSTPGVVAYGDAGFYGGAYGRGVAGWHGDSGYAYGARGSAHWNDGSGSAHGWRGSSANWDNGSGNIHGYRGGSANWSNGSGSAHGYRGGSASWGGGSGSFHGSRGRSGSWHR